MVLLTDVYRNLTSLRIKPRERAFKQFKSPVLNVLRVSGAIHLLPLHAFMVWTGTSYIINRIFRLYSSQSIDLPK
jgi:hypothetical protein